MKIRLALLAASSALLLSLAVPAMAEGTASDDYVANVRQHVAFLEQSSRLAAQRATNDKLRAFATAEGREQQVAYNRLRLWESRSLGEFQTSMLEAPAAGPDEVVTGRSVGMDSGTGWAKPDTGVAMTSPGVLVMPYLANLDGEAFDTLYKSTQAASLKELIGFYEAYSQTGADPALRAMAVRQLPLVKQRLAEIEAL